MWSQWLIKSLMSSKKFLSAKNCEFCKIPPWIQIEVNGCVSWRKSGECCRERNLLGRKALALSISIKTKSTAGASIWDVFSLNNMNRKILKMCCFVFWRCSILKWRYPSHWLMDRKRRRPRLSQISWSVQPYISLAPFFCLLRRHCIGNLGNFVKCRQMDVVALNASPKLKDKSCIDVPNFDQCVLGL